MKRHTAISTLALLCMLLLLLAPPFVAQAASKLTYSPNEAYAMGVRMHREGRYELAAQYFRQASAVSPNNPRVRLYLADTLFKLRRLNEAQSEYQQVATLVPNTPLGQEAREHLMNMEAHLQRRSALQWGFLDVQAGLVGSEDRLVGLRIQGSDYVEVARLDGELVRWSLLRMPLKVYVNENPSGIRSFKKGYISTIPKALDLWSKALGNQLSYQMTNNKEQAQIVVDWISGIDRQGVQGNRGTMYTAGVTVPRIVNFELRQMTMQIATLNIKGEPHTDQEVFATVLHEMGHALGIMGHSQDIADVMHAESHRLEALSARDVTTIRRLYTTEAKYTNIPLDDRRNPVDVSAMAMAKSMDREIIKWEAEVQKINSALNWSNLSSAYLKKGSLLDTEANRTQNAGLKAESARWYQKALSASNEAVKREPQNAPNYYNRSLVHLAMKNNTAALEDVKTVLRLDPRDSGAYLQLAWIQAEMGRKAEAQNALKEYLLRDPAGANTPTVQRLQQKLATGS